MLILISASVVSTARRLSVPRALYPSGHEDGGQSDFCRKTNLQAGKLPACVEAARRRR